MTTLAMNPNDYTIMMHGCHHNIWGNKDIGLIREFYFIGNNKTITFITSA